MLTKELAMTKSIFSNINNKELSGVALKEQLRNRKIIAHLSTKKDSTIPELSEILNISIPKTTELLSGLLSEGLVKEMKSAEKKTAE